MEMAFIADIFLVKRCQLELIAVQKVENVSYDAKCKRKKTRGWAHILGILCDLI
jgi:hypothetical protein